MNSINSHRPEEANESKISRRCIGVYSAPRSWMGCFFIASFLLVLRESSVASASSGRSSMDALLSPIRNFGSSWAASSVQGTTIAIPFKLKNDGGDAVVLVLRSTASALSSRQIAANTTPDSLLMGGLRILQPTYRSSDALTANTCSQRWTFLGSTAVCAMTGFASDIDFLTRVLQNEVDEHRFTYEGARASSSSPMPTMQLVHKLAELLQEACQWQGGRPYGVQSLVIGHDGRNNQRLTALRIFSLDPSGGYRHWGRGTAIGRNAANVRKQLYQCLIASKTESGSNSDAYKSLEAGLRASILAQREESATLELSDRYEALLLWEDGNHHFCVAAIDPNNLDEIRQSIVKELAAGDEHKSNAASKTKAEGAI